MQEIVGFWLFIGTLTGGPSDGIYAARFDAASGQMAEPRLVAECEDPAWLIVHPKGNILYASHASQSGKDNTGGVSAWKIDYQTGSLKPISYLKTRGERACFVDVDSTGRYLTIAHYRSGSVELFALKPDGSIERSLALVQHGGASINPKRQKEPHAHAFVFHPSGAFAVSPDLGADKVVSYKVDAGLQEADRYAAIPGSGPRHVAFNSRGTRLYVLNELQTKASTLAFSEKSGALTWLQETAFSPTGIPEGTGAHIFLHPGGRWLFATNRRPGLLGIFPIDPESGFIGSPRNFDLKGQMPRGAMVTPDGRFVLTAYQRSNEIESFAFDTRSGELKPTGHVVQVPSPVALVMVPTIGK